MAGGGIVLLWTHAGIQITVLLSFTFQFFLFFFAGFRRRSASPVLNLLLWLVYLLADSTAIYALGHMSYSGPSGKHQLVAFWAPLLLVHLGGPDSITAYAIEDSRLWHRHLLTLVVQTLGAGYVLYNYVASDSSTGSLLLAASVLMFIVGVLKYGERTWALRCGSMEGIKSIARFIKRPECRSFMERTLKTDLLNQKDDNEEELLILANYLLIRCMRPFAGRILWWQENTHDIYALQGDDMYKLIQMQLSLMYDIMYTKTWVIHTWYGYCIRAISLVATIVSMLLFTFSNKNGYSSIDVDITYVLLAGTMVLEIVSVPTVVGSTWICAWLCSFGRTHRLCSMLKFLRRGVGAASKRRWSDQIGQYNMFHFITGNKATIGRKATKKLWLDKWWTSVDLVWTVDISKTCLLRLLGKTLPKLDPKNSRGFQILEGSGLGKEQAVWSHWIMNLEFTHRILIWHLSTDVYLHRSKEVGRQENVAEAVKILSNYMMFLLVTKPDMLPGYLDELWLDKTRHNLNSLWCKTRSTAKYCAAELQLYQNVLEHRNTEWHKKLWAKLKKLFHNDGPNCLRILKTKHLASSCLSEFLKDCEEKWEYAPPEDKKPNSSSYDSAYGPAAEHAAELLHLESSNPDLLEVIFGVWVEMLVYATYHCGLESHARQLGRGGEFITLVWILVQHYKFPLLNN